MFERGQIIEHKQTGTRALIVEVKPATCEGGWNHRRQIRYYIFYVPQNPAYNHHILQESTTMMTEFYRVIT